MGNKKIKVSKKYKAIYTKWGANEEIQFVASAIDIDDENIITIAPKNNIVQTVKDKTVREYSIEEYAGEHFLCSKYMSNLHELKEKSDN